MLEGHHMTQKERVLDVLFSNTVCTETCFLPRKTTKQAVRRSVKQSGPTVNQNYSHA